MTSEERFRRPEPAREQPQRRWQGAFRAAAADDAAAADGVVSRAVETGYRVIAEQLELGRTLAQQFAPDAASLWDPAASADASRWLDAWAQWSTMMVDWMAAAGGASRPPADGRLRLTERDIVTYDVRCPRPWRLGLDVRLDEQGEAIALHPLHAVDAARAPLSGVSLHTDEDTGLRLTLQVADDTAPGRYTGVVVARDDNSPRGTVTLELLD